MIRYGLAWHDTEDDDANDGTYGDADHSGSGHADGHDGGGGGDGGGTSGGVEDKDADVVSLVPLRSRYRGGSCPSVRTVQSLSIREVPKVWPLFHRQPRDGPGGWR